VVAEVVAERSERMPRADAASESHTGAGEEPQTETVERQETLSGIDSEGGQKPQTEVAERGETLFGVNLDSPFIVTAVITIWSLIALGLAWQARWALVGGIGWAVLSVLGDGFELASKAPEANWGLSAAVLVVGAMHLGVVYMCFRAVRQGS